MMSWSRTRCVQGVIVYFRVVDGEIRRGDKIKFMANGVEREVSVRMQVCVQ